MTPGVTSPPIFRGPAGTHSSSIGQTPVTATLKPQPLSGWVGLTLIDHVFSGGGGWVVGNREAITAFGLLRRDSRR